MERHNLVKNGNKVAVIDPFPGEISAEHEVILRMLKAADEVGIDMTPCDRYGRVLDDNLSVTDKFVDERELAFAISMHYETHKALDTFYYHALWNPPEIPLNDTRYEGRILDNYIMNDDFLIYDSGGISNHLRSVLMDKPRTLQGASVITASFPVSAMMEPKLDHPLMFYCGMNWESSVHHNNRHEGLFRLLDQTGKVRFFGPNVVKAWGGIRPWAGYQCYQRPIPFDGFSIVKEINECGVCLVLSSDAHRRAGASTTRLFEACVAGAVIISDENEYVIQNFRDAALFINYNRNDPNDTFRQIMEKYEWITAHPNEALRIARRAQEIFIREYSMNVQLKRVLENHSRRQEQVKENLYARDSSKRVLVTFVLNTLEVEQARTLLEIVFANVQRQSYPSIELAIAADQTIASKIRVMCAEKSVSFQVCPMQLYDSRKCRIMTNGQAIRRLQKGVAHDYYTNIGQNEIWFSDHITTLVRTIEDTKAQSAYSGSLVQDAQGLRNTFVFGNISRKQMYDEIYNSRFFPAPGQFLIAAQAHDSVPDYVFDCLDGKEHYAYAGLLSFVGGQLPAFSHRMTLCIDAQAGVSDNEVMDDVCQSRFVRGLIREHLPDSTVGGFDAYMLAEFPLRTWLRIQFWRTVMYHTTNGSVLNRKSVKKYKALTAKLVERLG